MQSHTLFAIHARRNEVQQGAFHRALVVSPSQQQAGVPTPGGAVRWTAARVLQVSPLTLSKQPAQPLLARHPCDAVCFVVLEHDLLLSQC